LTDEDEAKLRQGVKLDDGPTQGVELQFIQTIDMGQSRGAWYMITVREGRNRLVRRLFEQLGNKVVRLLRYSYGELYLPESLKPGEYRQLTSQEIQSLKNAVGLKD
jgi:23S rRNA pseudouridine2605 synthase